MGFGFRFVGCFFGLPRFLGSQVAGKEREEIEPGEPVRLHDEGVRELGGRVDRTEPARNDQVSMEVLPVRVPPNPKPPKP